MMNKIWSALIIVSVLTALFNGNIDNLSSGIIDGASNAVNLIFTIGGMMCLWSGIMNIADKAGLTKALSYAFSPILSRVLPDYKGNQSVMGAVSMNISANLLGLGNAATPFGILAMNEMVKYSKDKSVANNSMVAFVVLNTASIQIMPTTVAALRRAVGSTEPMSILPYVWISSACALTVGISLVYFTQHFDASRRL